MKITKVASWLLIDELWRIFLIKRKYNKKHYPSYWSFPWWHQEEDETQKQTAMREVKEETNLDFMPTNAYFEEKYELEWKKILYDCKYLWTFSWEIKIQKEECDGYAWFSYDETKNLLVSEKIRKILDSLYKDGFIK